MPCVSRSNYGGTWGTTHKESCEAPTSEYPRTYRYRNTLLQPSLATRTAQASSIGLNALTKQPKLHLRNFTWGDIDKYFGLLRDVGAHGHRDWPESVEGLLADLNYPRVQPEKNLALAEITNNSGARILGYAIVEPEQNIGRSVVGIANIAENNREEVNGKLLDWAATRAASYAPLAHLATRGHEAELIELVKGFGWRQVRTYLKLEGRPGLSKAAANIPAGFTVRPMLSLEELPGLTNLQNEAFKAHFGFSPNTADEIEARLLAPGARLDDIVFIHDIDERPVAYCWTQTDERAGTRFGRIGMTGVSPEARGRGLGRAIAESGFNHLLEQGVETIELDVDADNGPAINIYKSLGFTTRSEIAWWEKSV